MRRDTERPVGRNGRCPASAKRPCSRAPRAAVTAVPARRHRAGRLQRADHAEPVEDPDRLGAHVLRAGLVAGEGGAVHQRHRAAGGGEQQRRWRCPPGRRRPPARRPGRAQAIRSYSNPSRTSRSGGRGRRRTSATSVPPSVKVDRDSRPSIAKVQGRSVIRGTLRRATRSPRSGGRRRPRSKRQVVVQVWMSPGTSTTTVVRQVPASRSAGLVAAGGAAVVARAVGAGGTALAAGESGSARTEPGPGRPAEQRGGRRGGEVHPVVVQPCEDLPRGRSACPQRCLRHSLGSAHAGQRKRPWAAAPRAESSTMPPKPTSAATGSSAGSPAGERANGRDQQRAGRAAGRAERR